MTCLTILYIKINCKHLENWGKWGYKPIFHTFSHFLPKTSILKSCTVMVLYMIPWIFLYVLTLHNLNYNYKNQNILNDMLEVGKNGAKIPNFYTFSYFYQKMLILNWCTVLILYMISGNSLMYEDLYKINYNNMNGV